MDVKKEQNNQKDLKNTDIHIDVENFCGNDEEIKNDITDPIDFLRLSLSQTNIKTTRSLSTSNDKNTKCNTDEIAQFSPVCSPRLNKNIINNLSKSVSNLEGFASLENYWLNNILNLLKNAENKAKRINKRANIYKITNIICILFIIIASMALTIITAMDECQNLIISAISASITAIQIFYKVLDIGNKGAELKFYAVRLQKIVNDSSKNIVYLNGDREILNFANCLETTLNNIDMEVFNITYENKKDKILK